MTPRFQPILMISNYGDRGLRAVGTNLTPSNIFLFFVNPAQSRLTGAKISRM